MWIYAAFAALMLLLPILGVLPPVFTGKSDTNWPFHITMQPRNADKFKTQPRVAVLSQEVAEWWLKWAVALAIAAPVALLLSNTLIAFASPIAALAATSWTRFRPLQRQLELIGHAVEVVAAERLGRIGYATREAMGMQRSYDGLFEHLTVVEIIAAMDRRRWLARLLLALLHRRIRRAS